SAGTQVSRVVDSKPALVAQRRERQVPNLEAGGSNPSGGTVLARTAASWRSGWGAPSAKRVMSGSTPGEASTRAIHYGSTQGGAGCPAASHKGGRPGSTPGPATRRPLGRRGTH